MPDTHKQLLIDVRKSYRLLHDYQRLLLDAVSYIGNQLGFNYHSGHPHFSGKAKNNLSNWAWDWLNLYFHEFLFVKDDNGKLIRLAAVHIADSLALEVNVSDKTDISKFPSVYDSRSKIVFFTGKEDNLTSADHWTTEFLYHRDQLTQLAKDSSLPEKCVNIGMQSMSFDLEEIFTEQGASNVVKRLQNGLSHLHGASQ